MNNLSKMAEQGRASLLPSVPMLAVGMGTCGIGNGAGELYEIIREEIRGKDARMKSVGCFGLCSQEPLVTAYCPGKPMLIFSDVKPGSLRKILEAGMSVTDFPKLSRMALAKISRWETDFASLEFGASFPHVPEWNELPMLAGQKRIILRNAGIIDPENIFEYAAMGGYGALAAALGTMKPDDLVAELSDAGLRGRGGGGFPTAEKWRKLAAAEAREKYLVCNADEGDPGAYMNRNEMESDPHVLIEGMLLGAYATGATKGFIYIRNEYPLAVYRLKKAIDDASDSGLLGDNILGTGFSFTLDIVQGAGAFVCGEETALIASAEGKSGRPAARPPYPVARGYLGQPTCVCNVETWCNAPYIIGKGAREFRKFGTEKSPGTKVFSLAGKIRNTGLVEVPYGTTLNAVVYGMGEGAGTNKRIRAVQVGGPSGGCIPVEAFGTGMDYESFTELGSIMGSGGIIVMDQDNCMVDVARYFTAFNAAESCGKCASCREGLDQMLRILDAIVEGTAAGDDLELLEQLALVVKDTSLCGLGRTSANSVLTTLRYFRSEYEAHIRERRCDAGVCENLFEALCENSCPLHMNIPGYLALLLEDRIEDAYELTLRDNPLPGTIGRICHFHCQMRCRRETLDESVAQGDIHRYLADTMFKLGTYKNVWARLIKEKKAPVGFSVAIVGAGPAGLAAGYFLVRLGYEVTIFDANAKPGGMLRYGIPAFRLPKDILDHELELLKKLGIRFVFNTRVGEKVEFAAIKEQFGAVIIAIGAQKDRKQGIPGEDLPGVHLGYQWLTEYAQGTAAKTGRRCLVIGGGNVSIDVARTLVRLDRDVTVAYRRGAGEMTANRKEADEAMEEEIRFEFMLQPEAILGENGKAAAVLFRVMKAGGIDGSGRHQPVPSDKTVRIPADDVFIAMGEEVEATSFECGKIKSDGTIAVDPFTMRVEGNVFAIGDAVNGPSTAAESMGQAKKAAEHINEFLMNNNAFSCLYRRFTYSMTVPVRVLKTRRVYPKKVLPDDRRTNFQEVVHGFSGEQARAEARRCLRCDVRNNAMSPWR